MDNYPNIVFIMSDQHHANCLGCYGNPVIQTPNHDFIAQGGVRFTSAYANNPICGPSRTCFFSGRYVHQHGVYGNTGAKPECSQWMTEHFRRHGYTTAGIGKMHMGYKWVGSQMDYVRNENLFDAPPDDPLGPMGAHYHRYLVEKGKWENYMSSLEYSVSSVVPQWWPCATSELPEEDAQEAWIGRETIQYLRKRDRRQPFFLHVSFPRPHDPLLVPKPFDNMYKPSDIILPANHCDDFHDKSPGIKEQYQMKHKYPYRPDNPDGLRRVEAYYYGLISLNDKYLGMILDELRVQNILEDTIIVFTADHGDFAGEHGLHFKNLGIYEAVHRIPFLIRYPKKIAGTSVCNYLIESVDLYPTLCDLAGLPAPEDIAGESIIPSLEGRKPWTKSVSVCDWRRIQSLRTREARMIYSADGRSCELYELREDPWEMNNVWDNSKYAKLRETMVKTLLNWYIEKIEKQGSLRWSANSFLDAIIHGASMKELKKRFDFDFK